MSYFDQITPAVPHQVLVDLTEFTKAHLSWRAGIERQILEAEASLNTALEIARDHAGEAAFTNTLAGAVRAATDAGKSSLAFAAFLPESLPEALALGKEIQVLRESEFNGPKWALQWGQISAAQGAIALKNLEILARRHPDWGPLQTSAVGFMAAHHQVQAGEPAPGEIYETLASRSELADVWGYLQVRFREEFPEMFALRSDELKNVSCGRALATAMAGTPQS